MRDCVYTLSKGVAWNRWIVGVSWHYLGYDDSEIYQEERTLALSFGPFYLTVTQVRLWPTAL